jgi:hypothetical protein
MANAYELGLALLAEHEGEEITVGELIRAQKPGPRRAALEHLVYQLTISSKDTVDEAAETVGFYIAHPDRQV